MYSYLYINTDVYKWELRNMVVFLRLAKWASDLSWVLHHRPLLFFLVESAYVRARA